MTALDWVSPMDGMAVSLMSGGEIGGVGFQPERHGGAVRFAPVALAIAAQQVGYHLAGKTLLAAPLGDIDAVRAQPVMAGLRVWEAGLGGGHGGVQN